MNEVFDEEVGEEVEGDFQRTLDGRDIWFRKPEPFQFHGWKRYRETLKKRYEKAKAKAQKEASLEILKELGELSEQFDMATIELIESLMVRPEDVEFVGMAMIGGRVTIADLHNVLFGEDEPDDDEAPKPKPKRPVSNAKRTRK